MTAENANENTTADAKHLGSGLLKFRRETVQHFSSLLDRPRHKIRSDDAISKKNRRCYGAEPCVEYEYESDQIWQHNYTDNADTIQSTKPTSAGSSDTVEACHSVPGIKAKSLSADEFMKRNNPCKAQPQLDVSAQSGEGHCSGTCAMIPVDIRPRIKQAYADCDFDDVDLSPVYLPMLDDDGIFRLESSGSNK